MPINERPRERLIKYGVKQLSNEELLTVVIKNGTKNLSAKDLAQAILKETKNIKELSNISYEKLCSIKGIGSSKATTILSALELGFRLSMPQENIQNTKFNNVETVYNYFYQLTYNMQEHFYVIYLNNKNIIIKEKLLFIGTINASLVHPREIFKEAYLLDASSIICVHNHPSGFYTPSREDIDTTKRLNEVGHLLGIKLVDHIIVAHQGYYSFLENGYI